MRKFGLHRRLTIVVAAALVSALGVAAVSLGAGGATTSAKRVTVKCPKRVLSGKKRVTCRLKGKLPRGVRGPKGDRGPRGQRGPRGANGARGPSGAPGVSGYEVI